MLKVTTVTLQKGAFKKIADEIKRDCIPFGDIDAFRVFPDGKGGIDSVQPVMRQRAG